MLHAGKAYRLIGLSSVASDHIRIGNDALLSQATANGVRLDEAQELLPVLIRYVLIGVSGHGGEVGKMLSGPEARRIQVGVRLIADARVLVQLEIIHAPIIGCQSGKHPVLLFPLPLLFQQLFLQRQAVLQFFPLHAVFRLGGLLFQKKDAVSLVLRNDKTEHHQHRGDGQRRLDHAPSDGPS